MAVFKCKMCGGDLEILEGATVAECEYCGTKQTVTTVNDENLQNLFNRANTLRIKSEFDKAEKLYEKIIQADSTLSEAYWGLILCKYGIEYVDDPKTFKKIPTCHRASYDSVIADDDYKSALVNADSQQRVIYEEQAKEIDRIQKEILALAQREESYDVFICYKETDANGQRTQDSVIANDIYYQLTQEGFKVFYAAITLEGKLGSAYEPIIFAALNSAKVMLAIGTKPEHFNAVWVKNEWSRFLKIIKNDRSKLLIPCYRNMDAYELPEDFAHLQAQDMGKIGFVNDVVRGIKKVVQNEAPKANAVNDVVVTSNNSNTAPLLERAFMFLEDGDFFKADEFCEQVLNLEPKNAKAYVGKLMCNLKVNLQEGLKDCAQPFNDNNNYQKAIRFADDSLKNELEGYIEFINIRNENTRLETLYTQAVDCFNLAMSAQEYYMAKEKFSAIENYKDSAEFIKKADECALESTYKQALALMSDAKSAYMFTNASEVFKSILDYKDSKELFDKCLIKAEESRKDEIYNNALTRCQSNNELTIARGINELQTIPGWRDADELVTQFQYKIGKLRQEEKERQLAIKKARKRNIIAAAIILGATALIIVIALLTTYVFIPNFKYNSAVDLMNDKKYPEAISAFEELDGYKDSADKIKECNIEITDEKYNNAVNLMTGGKYLEAKVAFEALGDYKDSKTQAMTAFQKSKFEIIKNANVGDYIYFGTYEQDNITSNGKENIVWLVLEKTENRILVISKDSLDYKQYHNRYSSITWENSYLRKWLNGEFVQNNFSSEEKAHIPLVQVSTDKNPKYGTVSGNATMDNVFLLSISEVNRYFNSSKERICTPTTYATSVGNVNNYSSNNNNWWLRSPGFTQSAAAVVDNYGEVREIGLLVDDGNVAVRPAMWINIT